MPTATLTADHARRFLVRRHLLAPPRSLPAAPASVLDVVARLGSLQFDPLEYPGARNHDLVLHARIAGCKRGWCEGYLYGAAAERRLFEVYNKSLNIVAVDDLAYHRVAWERATERYDAGLFRQRPAALAAVLERLRAEGPLATAAFASTHGAPIDWHWAPTAEGRALLEALFFCGRVAIARRDGNRRYYDLVEQFPPAVLARRVDRAAALRHRLLSRHRAVGLMGSVASTELVSGAGTAAERRVALAALVEAGALVPVAVEGVRGLRYVLAEEAPLLAAAAQPDARATPHATLLAPLDPLVWDRALLRSLFGFDYVWEVYTPEARRRHGYYVLPLLFGDRLVGRVEPRFERADGVLRLVGLWFEPGFAPLEAPGFVPAFAAALAAYRAFVGARKVAWPRGRVATALAHAVSRVDAPD